MIPDFVDTAQNHARVPDPDPVRDGPSVPDSLEAVLAHCWTLLVRGAADRRSAMHTMVVATCSPDGPDARTVVLRKADPARRVLRFHTDRRSPKAALLTADDRVALLLYDPGRKVQLRIRGRARVEAEGPTAEAAWRGSALGSRACYRAPAAPSTPLETPCGPPPDAAHPDDGRDNFCAVEVTVERLEWLYLHHAGHRRAAFTWVEDGPAEGTWLAP